MADTYPLPLFTFAIRLHATHVQPLDRPPQKAWKRGVWISLIGFKSLKFLPYWHWLRLNRQIMLLAMQAAKKHHYLPVFYLKQWALQPGGKVVEFSRPFGPEVKARRIHPSGTGYVNWLYASEFSGAGAWDMERDFFSPVDSRAADAMRSLISGATLSDPDRQAWATFVVSLMCRMPEDVPIIKEMRKRIVLMFAPAFRRVFDSSRPAEETRTFEQLTSEVMETVPDKALITLKKIITNEKLIEMLCDMTWTVVSLSGDHELLTSDRPVTYTHALNGDHSHIVLPVGPRHLFIAARNPAMLKRYAALPKLGSMANQKAAEQASKLVYGSSERQLRFVQNRMSRNKEPQLMRRLLALQAAQAPSFLETMNSVPLDITPEDRLDA